MNLSIVNCGNNLESARESIQLRFQRSAFDAVKAHRWPTAFKYTNVVYNSRSLSLRQAILCASSVFGVLLKVLSAFHYYPFYYRSLPFQLTVADINTYVMTTGFDEIVQGVVGEFEKLSAFLKRVEDEPKVKEWIEKRPKTPFSIMSPKKE